MRPPSVTVYAWCSTPHWASQAAPSSSPLFQGTRTVRIPEFSTQRFISTFCPAFSIFSLSFSSFLLLFEQIALFELQKQIKFFK